MFNFLVIFLIVLIYSIFCLVDHDRKNEKLFLILSFFLLFILVGFRSMSTGSDTISYNYSFLAACKYKWKYLSLSRFEPGFNIFEILMSYITHNVRVFMLVISLVFNYFIYRFIKKYSKNYFLSVMMYICLLFFYDSMMFIRQFFAMIILMSFSYEYAQEKKLIPFVISVFIATQFHITSIVGLLIYPIVNMKLNKKRVFFLIVLSLALLYSIASVSNTIFEILEWNYTYKVRDDSYSLANSLYFITYFIMFIYSYIIIKRKKYINSNEHFYLYVMLLSSLICLVSIKMNVLSRVASYFTIFSITAFPNVLKENCTKRFALSNTLFITTILILYSTSIIYFRPEWNTAFNYNICTTENDCFIK